MFLTFRTSADRRPEMHEATKHESAERQGSRDGSQSRQGLLGPLENIENGGKSTRTVE